MTTQQSERDNETNVSMIEPFRIINSAKKKMIDKFFSEQSGLRYDQFASNSWGFPPIPIPSPRRASRRMRLAPTNVSNAFIGHPIYWIEPELTAHGDEESDEAWSIRMYYLLVGLGMFTENNEWVDFLQERGFDYSDELQIAPYHILSNPQCFADEPQYKFLSVDDLATPLEFVMASAENALVRCSALLEQEIYTFAENQQNSFRQAIAIIGAKELNDPKIEFDSKGGFWSRNIGPYMEKINTEYQSRLQNNQKLSPLTESVYDVVERAVNTMTSMDNYVANLAVPVIRSAETQTERFSDQMAFLKLSMYQNDARGGTYDMVPYIKKALETEREPDSFFELYEVLSSRFESCWKRLRLAAINYELTQNGQPPYETYTDFTVKAMSTYHRARSEDDDILLSIIDDK